MTKINWLEISESVALAGSILGTFAAYGTQQFIYAAAPLTLTVGLNIANRNRFNKQLRQQNFETLTGEVHRVSDPLSQRLETLETQTQRVNRQTQQQLSQLKESLESDREVAIARLQEAIQSLPPIPNLDPISQRLSELEASLQQMPMQTDADIEQLQAAFRAENEAAIAQIHHALENIPPIPNIKPISLRLEQLETLTQEVGQNTDAQLAQFQETLRQENEAAIARIHHALENIPPIENMEAIAQRLEQLETLTQELRQNTEAQLAEFQDRFRAENEAAIARIQQLIQTLPPTENLSAILQRLDILEQVQKEAIANQTLGDQLSENSVELHQLIQSLPPTPTIDAIHQHLEKLDNFTQQLQTQTQQQIEDLKTSQRQQQDTILAQVHQILDPINQRLAEFESQGQSSTAPPDSPRAETTPISIAPLPELTLTETPREDSPKQTEEETDSESAEKPPKTPNSPPKVPSQYRKETFSQKPSVPTPPPAAEIPAEDEWDMEEWDGEDEWETEEGWEPETDEREEPESETDWSIKSPLKQFPKQENIGRVIGGLESSFGEVVGDIQGFVGKFMREKSEPETAKPTGEVEKGSRHQWKCIKTLSAHLEAVNCVAISPNGKLIASGDRDDTVRLWHLQTGEPVDSFNGEDWFASVNALCFSPDGATLACAIGDTITLWKWQEKREAASFSGQLGSIYAVVFLHHSPQMISGDGNSAIKVWNLENRQGIRTLTGHQAVVYALAVSPDDRLLISGSEDKTVKIWQLETGTEIHNLSGHSAPVYSLAMSPDGNIFASGSADGTIKIWNLKTGEELNTLEGHSEAVNAIAFHPDGETLLSASHDKTLKVWHLETSELIATLKGHSAAINSVAVSFNGKTIVTGSEDKTLKVWRM
ncbi:WD40 repeat domain-containing protein [Phormidium sp. CCY1219]|uniref:WD40 repeat domain-containing protein n=1 Tax=Phormidium sp. CCY1219 TaxID=2886104 RepID=UPI002D1ED2A2|nr:hypothetical protein [Phormidium sp. CCY1219]MEB3826975.1 hypothetical protein [Phormidium sp. CCY1219]